MWKKFVLNYLKTFKAVRKNNQRTHSPQHNKKSCVDDSYPFLGLYSRSRRESNCSRFTFVYQKRCFSSKTEKMNSAIEFSTFELV